jgi:hypothetical protein
MSNCLAVLLAKQDYDDQLNGEEMVALERRNAYRILVAKPEGNRTSRRLRCRWEDNMKLYIR